MDQKETSTYKHSEKELIEFLREQGYIETTEENGTWLTKGWSYKFLNQIDLRFIEQECKTTNKMIGNMGKDVWKICRWIEEELPVKFFSALADTVKAKLQYQKGLAIGFFIGFVLASIILIIAQVLGVQ